MTLALECSGPDASSRARLVLEEQAQVLGDRVDDLEARASDAKNRLAGAAVAMQQFQVAESTPYHLQKLPIDHRRA